MEIARKILGLPNDANVLKHIKTLESDKQKHLRETIDWVEDYEKDERRWESC